MTKLHPLGEHLQANSELGGASNLLPRKLATFLMRPVKRGLDSQGEEVTRISEADAMPPLADGWNCLSHLYFKMVLRGQVKFEF